MTEAIRPSFPLALDTNTAFTNYQSAESTTALGQSSLGQLISGNSTSFTAGDPTYTANTGQANSYQVLSDQTPQPFDSATASSINPGSINARPNILNDYSNYTYHIRFSMVNKNSAYSIGSGTLDNVDKVIIAESGVTSGFNVTKFSFENTVSPGFRHQNMNVLTWKMTITEPFGCTFPDYLLEAGKAMNVENTNRFPYFIELWFDGYDEQGNRTTKIGGYYKVWRVIMLTVGLVTNQTGSIYEITGITDNDLVNTDQMAMTKSSMKLDQVQTLQDVTNKLAETLNKDAKVAEHTEAATTYKINLPSFMRNWRFDPVDNTKHDARNRSDIGTSIPINRGQDIGSFIITSMSKCGDEADKFFFGSTVNNGAPSVETHGLAQWVQIIPQMTLGNYNTDLNDYQKLITYNVLPFLTPRCVKDPDQAKKQKQLPNQQRKFNYLNSRNMIAKKYEYYYTGKNSEVLKFDIHIENWWQITLPNYLGGRSYGQSTIGATVAPESQGFRELKGYSALYQLQNEISARAAQALDIISGLSTTVGGFGQLTGMFGINGLSSQLNTLSGTIGGLGNMASTLQGIASGNIGSLVGQAQSAINQFGNLSTLTSLPLLPFNTGYASTVQTLASNTTQLIDSTSRLLPTSPQTTSSTGGGSRRDQYLENYAVSGDTGSDDPLKVAFFVDQNPMLQQSTFNGSERKNNPTPNTKVREYPPSQGVFSQTIGSIYDKTYMLNIEIEIRGDPWWIGMSNLEQNAYVSGISSGSQTSAPSDVAPFTEGENLFLLTFRTATNYDEDTGIMNPNISSQTFNGLYAVQMVENIFENGMFTQRLTAYKEPFSQQVDKLLSQSVDTKTSVNN